MQMNDERTENLPMRINDTLMQVFNQIVMRRRVSYEMDGKSRLTMVEAEMCLLIKRRNGIIGSEIADALNVTRSATSQFISKLKEKGLVRIEADSTNARLKRVYLTPEGEEAAAAGQEYADKMLDALYDVPEDELQHYFNFVSKLQSFQACVLEEMKA